MICYIRLFLAGCLVAVVGTSSLSAQDTIFYQEDTIRVGELEWDIEKDYKGKGVLLSQNKDLYGEDIHIYIVYHKNSMANQILFGYMEGEDFIPHGPGRYYYDSGQLLGKRRFENGLLEGPAEDFYKSGKLRMRTQFEDNQLNGPFTSYYENETIDQEGEYRNDTVTGNFRSYFSNGQLQWVEYYDDQGRKQGNDSTFYETGDLESVYPFKDDLEDGEGIFYHRNGKVWTRRIYARGRLLQVTEFRNAKGIEVDKGNFAAGNGWLNVYNDAGTLVEREKYRDGELVKVKRVRRD